MDFIVLDLFETGPFDLSISVELWYGIIVIFRLILCQSYFIPAFHP